MSDLRMNAYYYGFDPTGNRHIDLILSAIATAGKLAHHTSEWGDPHRLVGPFRGECPIDWMQNAATDAAAELARLAAENAKLRAALVPFAHEELSRALGGNVEGDDSPVFSRGHMEEPLRLRDFRNARKALEEGK